MLEVQSHHDWNVSIHGCCLLSLLSFMHAARLGL
jgi:hypothetical protein